MTVKILVGDCRDILKTLPDKSVQMCCSSPPYYGLRDYGTASWEGGDESCDHLAPARGGISPATSSKQLTSAGTLTYQFTDVCGKCDAIRIDRQLGLEKTPAEYVEKMVEVFRGVRRVLRDDGTLWLNIGSSYASSGGERDYGSYDGATGRGPGARRYRSAPAYGTDGKEFQDSPVIDSSCSDLCDGCRDAIQSHRGRTAGNGQHPEPSGQLCETTGRGTEPLACAPEAIVAAPLSAPVSTTLESLPLPPGECSHCGNCGVCLSVLRSVLRDSRLCARMSVGSVGTAPTQPLSGGRNGDTELSFSAYSNITSLRFKPKDLIPIPWMLAMALQQDGWYLRADVIWSKPNPMPESVTDRPTKSHEYLFLLSKSASYYYDADAIAERLTDSSVARLSQPSIDSQEGSDRVPGKTNGNMKAVAGPSWRERKAAGATAGNIGASDTYQRGVHGEGLSHDLGTPGQRNKRSVWTISTQPFREAHFATFPPKLIEPCILAGSARQSCERCGKAWGRQVERTPMVIDRSERTHEKGRTRSSGTMLEPATSVTLGFAPSCDCGSVNPVPSTVLDPFGGAGTTGLVADRLGRNAILIELNEKYAEMARRRITDDAPLFVGGVA